MWRCCAASVVLVASLAHGQDGTPVFRATSDLVLIDVQVLHNKTNTLAGELQAKDFELAEDGVPQAISFFGRDQLPLSVVLLFDLTDSVRGVLHQLAYGAQTALDRLKPEDEVAVMVYAASARVVEGFTRDRARTASAIARAARMTSNDAAFFNEAIYQASRQLEEAANPSSRRVILWLTDNLPNLPTDEMLRAHDRGLRGAMPHTEEEGIRRLHESGTVVMPMLLKDFLYLGGDAILSRDEREFAREHPGSHYAPGDAHKYAEITGGFAFEMRGREVQERLTEVIENLRSRYTIGYRPADEKPAGTFCRVKVTLSRDAPLRPREWRVLARAGYYRK